jgi:hypothetical protein
LYRQRELAFHIQAPFDKLLQMPAGPAAHVQKFWDLPPNL